MQENWSIWNKQADFMAQAQKFGIDPVIAKIIRNRDVVGDEAVEEYLNGGLDRLHDPHTLSGANEAAAMLLVKIRGGKKIRVIGDYDIDGVNASYILVTGLKRLGADVSVDIPERMKDGYGLNVRLIDKAADEQVDTIITCDNGIAASEQIAHAKELGMTVIVTDHHEVPYHYENEEKVYDLPPADVIVNPKLPGDQYPFKGICGAVVAWKVITVAYTMAGMDPEAWKEFLPYGAFATVGDVMDLCDENRIIVKYGLRAMETTQDIGLRALIRACGLEEAKLAAYHLGFVLGPSINAAGRLETARISLSLLLEQNPVIATAKAQELVELNEDRKLMTEEGVQAAFEQLEATGHVKDKVHVVYLPNCHESIAGIIAGKVREAYNHPAFVLTDSQEDGLIKGSGRSIEEYHMYDHLVKCDDLLAKYGGHALAAGLSLEKDKLEEFRRRLQEGCELSPEQFAAKVRIDVAAPVSYLTERLVEQLNLLEPTGKGNEKPLFAQKDLGIRGIRRIGKSQNMLKLSLVDHTGTTMDALWFGDADKMLDYYADKFGRNEVDKALMNRTNNLQLMVTYYPQINEFNGRRSLQIIIKNYK